jgi:succinyl-CoA synthetase alpha subunit
MAPGARSEGHGDHRAGFVRAGRDRDTRESGGVAVGCGVPSSLCVRGHGARVLRHLDGQYIAKEPVAGEPAVGIVSRSGTLTYQALYELKLNDIGVTTCVGIGGDPVPGTTFIDCLQRFEADPDTKAVMMIGEIGGSAEEEAAEFIAKEMSKPVVSYIAGVTAPAGKKMGHAGAIVSGGKGTADAKMAALREAGAQVGNNPTEAGNLMVEVVKGL